MVLLQLFVCFSLFQGLPSFAHETAKKCMPSHVVLKNLENQYEVKISEVDLSVTLYRTDVLGETTTKNVTEILVQSADVFFAGHVHPKESYSDKKISRSFNVKNVILELAQKAENQISCKVSGGEHISKRQSRTTSSLSQQERIEFVLHGLTEACLQTQICEQLNIIISNANLVNEYYEKNTENSQTFLYTPQRPTAGKPRDEQEAALQNAINALFDFGLSAGISRFIDSKGLYHLPEVTKNFTAVKTSGVFTARNSTFDGLKTMRRIKDVIFTNVKNNYTIGTTLRLSTAIVNIPSYYIRYGYANINGHVNLDIKGLSLTIKVSADYNSAPCRIYLNEMKIHDVGYIDVNISGLGWPLNSILEPVIRAIVKTTVFEKAKETIIGQAKELNCEKYRPTYDINEY